MSFESGNFNNNDNQEFRPVYYSPVTMKNENSTIDPSELSFMFWKGLLGISISPKIENSNTSYTMYDHKNNIKIYLNHTKARMLAEEMKKLKANPDTYKSVGVNSGSNGIITVCNGKEVGVPGLVVIIRKIDASGAVLSSFMYEFNSDTHFAIQNFDESTLKYDKTFYPDIEFDEFINVLESYYTQVPGYIAHSVIDANRKNQDSLYKNLSLLMQKFDVPMANGKGSRGGSSKSFFDMGNQGSQFAESAAAGVPDRNSTQTTLDDLAGEV